MLMTESGQRPMSSDAPSSRTRKYVSCPARERPSIVKCGVGMETKSLSIDERYHLGQTRHSRPRNDILALRVMRRDGYTAHRRIEMNATDSRSLRAPDIDIH